MGFITAKTSIFTILVDLRKLQFKVYSLKLQLQFFCNDNPIIFNLFSISALFFFFFQYKYFYFQSAPVFFFFFLYQLECRTFSMPILSDVCFFSFTLLVRLLVLLGRGLGAGISKVDLLPTAAGGGACGDWSLTAGVDK